MSRNSGQNISRMEHLSQSVGDILSTFKTSRLMLRDYGSDIPLKIDAPTNEGNLIDIYAAVINAIDLWEPRLSVLKVNAQHLEAGGVLIDLKVFDKETSKILLLEGIKI